MEIGKGTVFIFMIALIVVGIWSLITLPFVAGYNAIKRGNRSKYVSPLDSTFGFKH
jgi:Tfp pilus assembly protein PilE